MNDDQTYRNWERPTTNYTIKSERVGYTTRSTEDPEPSVYERYQAVFCNTRCCYRHEPDHMKMEPCINCPAEQFVEYMESLDEEDSMNCVEHIKPREIDVWINGKFIGTYGSMTAFNETREKPRRDTDIGIQLELVGNLVVEFFDNINDDGTPKEG